MRNEPDQNVIRRTFLKGAAAVAAILAAPRAVWSAANGKRPNVILILTDDQGYGDLSCHGNPALKTPNLDRLHGQSVRLTDFHVAPMCSPTRGQLLTGFDAMRNGATAVCEGRSMIRQEVPTIADIFRAGGYSTGHFGKWHLGDSYPYRPHDRGFDETIHHAAWGITSLADYYSNDYWDDTYRHNDRLQKYEGFCTDVWFDEAMAWMAARDAEGKPFFCYLPTNCPHGPNLAPEEFVEPYKKEGLPAGFYGQIANIDVNVGRLMAWLEKQGIAEDTIVIFMTDNGTSGGQKVFDAGMRGAKTQVWEGGHRVPCFIRWPGGGLGKARDIDQLTECQDILPTLIDLCGLRPPAGAAFDGASLAGLLKGTAETLKDRMLVVQYRAKPAKGSGAVMWKKWRLVGGELYDLRTDPRQEKNVAAEHPEVVAAMQKHYDQWWDGVQEPLAQVRWIHLGNIKANPTMLYANDWDGDYADNRGNLTAGKAKGQWNVAVEQDGLYRFTLYRWWPESDKLLDDPLDPKAAKPVGAVPIASAGLRIGDVDLRADKPQDKEGAKSVSFTAQLKAGKYQLRTMFYDDKRNELCSAYYTRVQRA